MSFLKDPKVWLHGLIAAFIGGGASAGAAAGVDPDSFNLVDWEGFLNILKLFAVSGLFSVFAYLKKSPLPEISKASCFLILILSVFFFSGCSSLDQLRSSNDTPRAEIVFDVTPHLPTIKAATTVACGAYLKFGIEDDVERGELANQMYAAAKASRTLMNGETPTVKELENYILQWGFTDREAEYAEFAAAVAVIYEAYYPDVRGSPKQVIAVLSALAEGVELATKIYVEVK